MLRELTTEEFLKELASKKAVPGGGSAAALSGALAAGLVAMAGKISGKKKIAEKSEKFMKALAVLIDKDAGAFKRVIEEKSSQGSLEEATEIPLQTAKYSYEVLKLAEILSKNCNPKVITDVGAAAKLAEASVESALLNVKINLVLIKDERFKKRMKRKAEKFYLTGYLSRAILNQIQACLR